MASGFVRAAGGLPAETKALLTPENLREGVHIRGGGVDVTGTFTSDATAQAGQILAGQTAYVQGEKVTGVIPAQAAATYTPGTANQTIPAGVYLEGAQTIAGDAALVPGNIRSGASIFGVAGNYKEIYYGMTYGFTTDTNPTNAWIKMYNFDALKNVSVKDMQATSNASWANNIIRITYETNGAFVWRMYAVTNCIARFNGGEATQYAAGALIATWSYAGWASWVVWA